MTFAKHTPAGKRQRLIDAARQSYHQRGIAESTLKIIAAEADVPLGNVYYYFPSKDDLTLAVLQEIQRDVREWLASYEQYADPRERLVSYLQYVRSRVDWAVRYGCPVAMLAIDLRRHDVPHAQLGAEALVTFRSWFIQQFGALPVEDPTMRAEELLAAVHGAYAVAHASNNPELFTRLLSQLCEQVRKLPSPESDGRVAR